MHVLVVDDLKEDRFILKKLLQSQFSVTTLSSAREARAFALSHPFDIALLNVMLQEDLDGIELLHDLRSIAAHTFLPLATTCYVDNMRYQRLLRAGFRAVLQKPFDIDTFALMVRHHENRLAPIAR